MIVDKQTVEGRVVDEIHYLVDMDDSEEAEVRLINYAKDDSKRKVIEELESIIDVVNQNGKASFIIGHAEYRIQELKQD